MAVKGTQCPLPSQQIRELQTLGRLCCLVSVLFHPSSSCRALGIPATECEFVGSLPVIVVGRLKVALEPQLWELGKVLRKAG